MDTDMWETRCKGAFDEVKASVKETRSEIAEVKVLLVGNGKEGVCDTVRNHKRYFAALWGCVMFIIAAVSTQMIVSVVGHIQGDNLNKEILEILKDNKKSVSNETPSTSSVSAKLFGED